MQLNMSYRWLAGLLAVLAVLVVHGAALGEEAVRTGTIQFQPADDEKNVPEQFRLSTHSFKFRQFDQGELIGKVRMSLVTFPSPVKTPHEKNNTVHCEYFCPEKADGRRPAVVVLHILGGDFPLSRVFCSALAFRGVPALFVKMPYYGPRRQPDCDVRMISNDPRQTVRGMTQAVLDIRRAAAWLASQQEVDDGRLGVFGISLGGITASLAAAAEPRFARVCPVLAGGDIAKIAWESPELARVRKLWIAQGGSQKSLYQLMKSVDPVTYAPRVRGRKILMLNARRDDVIPPACTESLWIAFGKPPIVWYDATHFTALKYLGESMTQVTDFFGGQRE